MKIETKKIYKCDYCGVCFDNFDSCKVHEDEHFTINNIPLTNQHYIVGNDIPVYIVVCGYRIRHGKVETNRFKYKLEGEYND